jgi:hypothetical protein
MTSQNPFPRHPDSLRQSLTNPIQLDRLEDNNALDTDFPTASVSKNTLRAVLIQFGISAFLLSIFPSLIDAFLPIPWAIEIWSFLTAICLIVVLTSYFGFPRSPVGIIGYLLAVPIVLLGLVYLRSSFAILVVAAFATALFADNYAKQVVFLGTTSPLPRATAKFIRSKWRSRFYSINTARGFEFYLLGFAFLLAVPWLIGSFLPKTLEGGTMSRFPAVAVSLALMFCFPVVLEIIAAVLFARRTLGVRAAWSGFKRSIKDWFTYNFEDLRAPGVLISPVGSSRFRRITALAVVGLWVAALNPMFSYSIGVHESILHARVVQREETLKAEEETRRKNFEEIRRLARGESEYKSYESPKLPKSEDSTNANTPKKLEPFQERMLERMSPEDREAYFQNLASADASTATKAVPPAQKSVTGQIAGKIDAAAYDVMHPHETAEFSKGENSRFGLMFLGIFLIYCLPKAVVLGFATLFPLAFAYAISIRIASSLREQLETNPNKILSVDNWDRLVSDVKASGNKTEATSVLLGVNAFDNSPVLVPTKVFEEHAHILGDSGSGKTSMGISLILHQLIRQPDCSIVVIDLKGDDMALFEGTRLDAQAANKRFRWFTNELGRSTFAFNPLDQEYFHALSLYQKTDVISAALGLQYGTDYGRGYFSDANSDYLYRTLQAHPAIKNFEHLARILPSGYGVENVTFEMRKAASHLVSICQRLATTEALNITEHSQQDKTVISERIDFADVFRTPQVAYFSLPSTLGTAATAEIARIALYSLIGSARRTPEPERKQVFVVIDEFQRILANNLELILQTARSMKVGIILANQSMMDLKKPETDITAAVRTNTRFKQVFAASNIEELQELVDASGESIVYQRSFVGELGNALSYLGAITKVTASEIATPRMRANDIMLATDAPQQSIVQIRRGMGYAQFGGMPFVMRSTFHIPPKEYLARKGASWPTQDTGTFEAREVQVKSLLDEFAPVDPLATVANKPKNPSASNASGVDDPLTQTFRNQSAKRNKYKKTPPQE